MKNISLTVYEEEKQSSFDKVIGEYAGSHIICHLSRQGLKITGKSKCSNPEPLRDMFGCMKGDNDIFFCDGEKKILRFTDPVSCDIRLGSPEERLPFGYGLSRFGLANEEEIMVVYHKEDSRYTMLGYTPEEIPSFVEDKRKYCCVNLSWLRKEHERYEQEKKLEEAEKKARKKVLDEMKDSTKRKLESFVKKCSFSEFFELAKKDIIGQDDQLMIACATVYGYLKALSRGLIVKENFIITAPSGCGKTQFFRTVKHILNDVFDCEFPVVQLDVSPFTESGFKGRNAIEIVQEIIKAGSNSGECICFLDEFDKKIVPSRTSEGENVNLKIQGELLTIIEGSVFNLFRPEENGNRRQYSLDTCKTLFIGLGAFQSIRDLKKEEGNKRSFGFTAVRDEDREEVNVYTDIGYDDIVAAGGTNELLGRFCHIVNFHRLSDEDYIKIVKEYVSSISSLPEHCALAITDEGAADFVQFSLSEMGIREMYRRVKETIRRDLVELMLADESEEKTLITIKGYMKTEITKLGLSETEASEHDTPEASEEEPDNTDFYEADEEVPFS